MGKLVLISPEGLVLSDNEPPKVEKDQEEDIPLHVIAARTAEQQSTKKHQGNEQ